MEATLSLRWTMAPARFLKAPGGIHLQDVLGQPLLGAQRFILRFVATIEGFPLS
jgi:hypothetical protein